MSKARRCAVITALADALVEQGWRDERLVRMPDLFPIDEGSIDLGALADAALVALRRPRATQPGDTPQAAGGRARAASMTPEERSNVARKAAAARWGRA